MGFSVINRILLLYIVMAMVLVGRKVSYQKEKVGRKVPTLAPKVTKYSNLVKWNRRKRWQKQSNEAGTWRHTSHRRNVCINRFPLLASFSSLLVSLFSFPLVNFNFASAFYHFVIPTTPQLFSPTRVQFANDLCFLSPSTS